MVDFHTSQGHTVGIDSQRLEALRAGLRGSLLLSGDAGYDESAPLGRSGGKRTVVESWRPSLPGPVLLVGDGVTDLEARPAVDRFVAYAGATDRPAVPAAADAVIRSASLLPVLRDELLDILP